MTNEDPKNDAEYLVLDFHKEGILGRTNRVFYFDIKDKPQAFVDELEGMIELADSVSIERLIVDKDFKRDVLKRTFTEIEV